MNNKHTKPATLSIIFLVILQGLYAQDYLITFSGSGQSNTVEAVEVKNIAQQTTLTLSGTDTLLLTDVVGTGDISALNQGMIVYPNPANHASRLEFYNSNSGNTRVEIYDFSGRLVIQKSIQLDVESHAFAISGLKAGIYLVKVNTPEHIYSQRLISTSVQGLTPELQYEGITQNRPQEPDLKSISNVVAMQYNEGERLVVKAIYGDYAHTKSLVPTESQNIDFEFYECVDYDGNHYGVVTIGWQLWMAENLKTTHFSNGIPIQYPGADNNAWANTSTDAYAWYNNDIAWKDIYGALYNWYATWWGYELCPEGWNMPSDNDWEWLTNILGWDGFPNESNNPNGAGNALKSCLQENSPLGGDCHATQYPRWDEDIYSGNNHHGFDAYGFSGLPCGQRSPSGSFSSHGYSGKWWTSSEYIWPDALNRSMNSPNGNVGGHHWSKNYGYSVRCMKNLSRTEVD